MIIIGHHWIDSPKFHHICSIEEIQQSSPKDIVLLEPLSDSHTLAQYCAKHHIAFAVKTDTLNEAIFANALGAKYLVCKEEDALMIQPIAQEYLFDTRILALLHDEKEIEKIARWGIDGVIFPEAIC